MIGNTIRHDDQIDRKIIDCNRGPEDGPGHGKSKKIVKGAGLYMDLKITASNGGERRE